MASTVSNVEKEKPRDGVTSLRLIAQKVAVCSQCRLSDHRKKPVPGEGPLESSFMFVGEGPGRTEDEQGLPFVGRAGDLLNELLSSVNLDRKYVYITNVVKCRPPENRDPQPDEVKSCSGYLLEQLEIVNPYVIVTLGRHSLEWFMPGAKIGQKHGQLLQWRDKTLIPLYHPAAGLRNPTFLDALKRDFKVLPEGLEVAMLSRGQKGQLDQAQPSLPEESAPVPTKSPSPDATPKNV